MSPYDEGRLAAAGNDASPYAEGTYHHAEWSRGFNRPAGEDDIASDAFEEGRQSAAAGHERETNPFDIHVEADAEKFERWDAGFMSAGEADEGSPATIDDATRAEAREDQ